MSNDSGPGCCVVGHKSDPGSDRIRAPSRRAYVHIMNTSEMTDLRQVRLGRDLDGPQRTMVLPETVDAIHAGAETKPDWAISTAAKGVRAVTLLRQRGNTMRKQRARNGTCKVTFELAAQEDVTSVHLCGEFNDWSTSAIPMTRRKDGTFKTTVALEADRSYRFRYLLDGERWENDWAADDYVPNDYGGDDAVVTT